MPDLEDDGVVKWLFGYETPLEDGILHYRLEFGGGNLENEVLVFSGEASGWRRTYGIGGDERAYVSSEGAGLPGDLALELRHGWNLVGLSIVPDEDSMMRMMEIVSVIYEAYPDEYGLLSAKEKTRISPSAFAKNVFWCYSVRNSRNLVLHGVVSDSQRRPDETFHGWQVLAAQPLLDEILKKVDGAEAYDCQGRRLQRWEGRLVPGKGYWVVIP